MTARRWTAAGLADDLLLLPVLAALVFWAAWLATAARAWPVELFPFGAVGFAVALAAAFAAVAAAVVLWRRGEPGASPPLGKEDALAFGVAALVTVLFWERALLRGWTPVNALLQYIFHPIAALVGEAVQKGVLPLWNPWTNAGSPLMADPLTAAFAPQNLPLFLFHFPTGYRLWILLQTALFFAFTYLWLRDKELSPAAACAGGGAAAFCATAVWHTPYLPHLASFLWMPALLHAAERRSVRAVALAAAQQLLAGHYQYAYMSWLAVAAALLARRATRDEWKRAAAGGAWGAALATFQLLPTWTLVRRSVRAGSLSFDMATTFSLAPGQLAKMLLMPQWIHLRPFHDGDPVITVFYSGVVTLGLAAWGAARAWGLPPARAALAWLAAGLFLALGAHNPFYRLAFHVLPGLSWFRFPAQWMGLVVVGLAVLAALGVHALPTRAGRLWTGLLFLDLWLFLRASPFLWVAPSFLTDAPPLVEDLRRDGGRVMETPAVEAWRYGSLPGGPAPADFSAWEKAKNALLPDQTAPYHIPEAKSLGNHPLKDLAALQAEAGRPGESGLDVLHRLGVSHLLALEGPASFRWKDAEGAWSFCRAADGTPVAADVDLIPFNAKRIRLRRPWPSDGPLELGEPVYPGWRAFSLGRPRGLLPDGPFQRVALKAGDQDVLLRYDAPFFALGAGASLLAFLALAWAAGRTSEASAPGRWAFPVAVGGALALKGFYDLVWGQPYANLFSPAPWDFVPARAFAMFAGGEIVAGLALLGARWTR